MRGAGTSIAGNAIGPGLIVDVSRHLDGLLAIDPAAMTATVMPGIVLDDLNRAAAAHGLRFGPDPSTHSRCTIGGMIGNDACGSHSVRWGTTAENVLGLEVVTADGVRRRVGALGDAAPPGGGAMDPALEARIRGLADRQRGARSAGSCRPGRGASPGTPWTGSSRNAASTSPARSSAPRGPARSSSAATFRLVRPPAVRALLVLAFADDIAAAAAVPALLPERPFTAESLTADFLTGWRDPGLLPPGGAWLLLEAGGETAGEMRGPCRHLAAASVGAAVSGPAANLLEDPPRSGSCGTSARTARVVPPACRTARPPGPGSRTRPCRRTAWPATWRTLRALLRDQDLRGITYGHFGEGCIHLRVGFGLDRPGGDGAVRVGSWRAAADLVVAHGGSLSGRARRWTRPRRAAAADVQPGADRARSARGRAPGTRTEHRSTPGSSWIRCR